MKTATTLNKEKIIKITGIKIENGDTITCSLDFSEEIKKWFTETIFFAQYNHDISQIPEGILIVPLLSNIMPVVWFLDAEIYVKSIDREFYDSLEPLKNAFQEMYPEINLGGKLIADEITENPKQGAKGESAVLFSGGLDSLASFFAHIEKKPFPITVWGADVSLDNEEGWQRVKSHNQKFASSFSLPNIFIKTNFKRFLNHKELYLQFGKILGSWWEGIQHGFGLLGLAAPSSFYYGFDQIYIPATHTKDFSVSWASCPKIDNKVRWAETVVIHDGYDLNRQDKVQLISKYIKSDFPNLQIRVCYKSGDGGNCGKCEKCSRTMTGLIAEGVNPQNNGFPKLEPEHVKRSFGMFKWQINDNTIFMWRGIQKRLAEKTVKPASEYLEYLEWLLNKDFMLYYKIYKFRTALRDFKNRVLNIFPK